MISVVICTYNRSSSLAKTLESLRQMTVPSELKWELIVVDNNSTDNTRSIVTQFARTSGMNAKYVLERQQGISCARNTGVANCNGEIIAFTDDDVAAHPGWLLHLSRAFAEHDCAAVAGKIVPVWKDPKPEWLEMEGRQGTVLNFDLGVAEKQIKCAPFGANAAFRRENFQKYGLFRLDLGVSGEDRLSCEETEFASRLIAAGEKIWYVPGAIIYHPVDPRRATKGFVLCWTYDWGRSDMRATGWSKDTVTYWGVPRWILRRLTGDFLGWMLSIRARQRFQNKLSTYRNFGRVVEAWRLSHGAQPGRKSTERGQEIHH